MKTFRWLLLLFLFSSVNAQEEIKGFYSDTTAVWSGVSLVGATLDTSAWISKADKHWFALYAKIYSDSTWYIQALGGDSLDFDIYYELHPGIRGDIPAKTATGYWRYKQTDALKILDFTTADTTNKGQWYQSFSAPYDSSGSVSNPLKMSPGDLIRFILKRGAKNKLDAVSIKFDLIFVEQS